MTTATIYWDRLRVEVKGHAGFAEKGQDIVCAGASTLTGALAGALEEAEARGRCECKHREKDGEALIWANPAMGSVMEIKGYFKMFAVGFRMLQEAYPGHVVIKEVR